MVADLFSGKTFIAASISMSTPFEYRTLPKVPIPNVPGNPKLFQTPSLLSTGTYLLVSMPCGITILGFFTK